MLLYQYQTSLRNGRSGIILNPSTKLSVKFLNSIQFDRKLHSANLYERLDPPSAARRETR